MKGLATMLRALGIAISPEHIQAIQELLPVLPQKLNEAWNIIHAALTNFDGRLLTLEKQNAELINQNAQILEVLRNGRRTDAGTDPGTGTGTAN